MAEKSGDGWIVWLILAGLGGLWAYETWWEDKPLPAPPPPAYSTRPTGPQYVTTTSSNTELMLDADSVRGNRQNRLAWVVSDHSKDKTVDVRETKQLYAVNCETTAYRNPSFVQYDAKGDVARSWNESDDDKAKTLHAVPDTIGESVVNAICASRYDPIEIPPPVKK